MGYKKTPSIQESEAFFRSMPARDERRAAKLGMISVGPDIVKRGRTREEKPEFLTAKPPRVFEPATVYLGDRLKRLTEPLTEQFKRDFRIPLKKAVYERYKQAGQRRNRPESVALATEEGDAARHARQVEHIADGAQRGAREKYNIAMLRRCALLSVYEAAQSGAPLNPTATQYAGNALVSFAEGLQQLPTSWKNYPYQSNIDQHIEWIGTYAQTNPEILRENPAVVLLVGQEQRREADYWKARYDLAVEVDGGERMTDADIELRDHVRQQIIDFGFEPERVPEVL